MIEKEIVDRLFRSQDTAYRDFQSALIPTVPHAAFIGVRTPVLRKIAKEYAKRSDVSDFLLSLPHTYFDEDQLHAFILSELKDFSVCLREVERFLPYVNNWATCDQMSPRCFKKHKKDLLPVIDRWISSDHTYTVRFAIGMLMMHFLEEDFDVDYMEKIAAIRSEEYYVNMMIAWYFATALAKQYENTLPYIKEKRLAPWTHNKAIRKAIESYRVSPERKEYLRTLRIKISADR